MPLPANYLEGIEKRLESEHPSVVVWEVAEAFAELHAVDPEAFTPRMTELYELVRFCNFDAIAPWLRDEREAVVRAARFAEKIGDTEVARILHDTLAGRPQKEAKISVTLPAGTKVLEIEPPEECAYDGVNYAGTDIALCFVMDGFMLAVLKELVAARGEIALGAPLKNRVRAKADDAVRERQGGASVPELFRQLAKARKPRMAAGTWEQFEERDAKKAKRIPLRHIAYDAPSAKLLKATTAHFGAAASEILSAYALHDGAELFVSEGECGFYLAPMAEWPVLLERAVEWAEKVTWNDEKDEIPKYLYSAIAFGLIPGDSERWLLVTEGPHAGTVMLSDTDLIEDEPRFASFGEFLAALLADAPRVLNSGGHVRYPAPDGEELFPVRYEFD
jgi:hypothetical protein